MDANLTDRYKKEDEQWDDVGTPQNLRRLVEDQKRGMTRKEQAEHKKAKLKADQKVKKSEQIARKAERKNAKPANKRKKPLPDVKVETVKAEPPSVVKPEPPKARPLVPNPVPQLGYSGPSRPSSPLALPTAIQSRNRLLGNQGVEDVQFREKPRLPNAASSAEKILDQTRPTGSEIEVGGKKIHYNSALYTFDEKTGFFKSNVVVNATAVEEKQQKAGLGALNALVKRSRNSTSIVGRAKNRVADFRKELYADLKAVATSLKWIGQKMKSIPMLLGKVRDTALAPFKWIKEKSKSLLNTMLKPFRWIGEKVKTVVDTVLKPFRWVGEKAKKFLTATLKPFKWVGDKVKKAFTTILKPFKWIASKIKDPASIVDKLIKGGLILELVSSVNDGFKEKYGDHWIAALVGRFARSMWEDAKTLVSDFVSYIKKKILGFFGIEESKPEKKPLVGTSDAGIKAVLNAPPTKNATDDNNPMGMGPSIGGSIAEAADTRRNTQAAIDAAPNGTIAPELVYQLKSQGYKVPDEKRATTSIAETGVSGETAYTLSQFPGKGRRVIAEPPAPRPLYQDNFVGHWDELPKVTTQSKGAAPGRPQNSRAPVVESPSPAAQPPVSVPVPKQSPVSSAPPPRAAKATSSGSGVPTYLSMDAFFTLNAGILF